MAGGRTARMRTHPMPRCQMPKTVLVLDDNSDELMIYTTLLRHAGYAIIAANDPDVAIRLASERRPDAALIDLHLRAEKDGCDVIDALRSDEHTRTMPVIVHTAFADLYHARLKDAGVARVLQKPLDYDRLLQAMEELGLRSSN